MARRKMDERLIDREDITEDIRLIEGSDTDYISPAGNVYKDYDHGKFLKKSNFTNKHNGYLYTAVTYKEGQRQRRALGVTKTGVLYSCKNEVSSKSKSGYYFRFDK